MHDANDTTAVDLTTTPSDDGATAIAGVADALIRARSALAEAAAALSSLPDDGARGAELRRRALAADTELLALEAELITGEVERGLEADNPFTGAGLARLADMWRARSEDLRVQARLGAMDLGDARATAVSELEAAGNELAGLVAGLRASEAEWSKEVRERANALVTDVRSAVTTVLDAVRG